MLSIEDDDENARTARITRIESARDDLAGIKVYRLERWGESWQPSCEFAIPLSPSRSIAVRAYGGGSPCPYARSFAAAAVPRLLADSLIGPLLYGRDGRDISAAGVCLNLVGTDADCRPAVGVAIPPLTGEILAAGAREPDLSCALFTQAVAEFFGPEFSPVVTAGACAFVRPDLGLQIEAAATDLGEPPADFGRQDLFDTGRAEIRLAGRSAVSYASRDSGEFAVYASPYDNPNRYGHVRLILHAVARRGVVTDGGEQLSSADTAKAAEVVTNVLMRHFS